MNTPFRAMLGAFVGDAAGATLEFYRKPITEEVAKNAMKMPGGGALKVGPGQITDDGELTLALWRGLKGNNPTNGFPYMGVMNEYVSWYNSLPFDVGGTCSNAFETMLDGLKEFKGSDDEISDLQKKIYNLNYGSEANGALMRASAIANWIASTDIEAFSGAEMAMEDASLSHPSRVCKEVNAIYVFTVINLLRGITPEDTLNYTNQFVEMNDFCEKVKTWYYEESRDITDLECTKQAGHVRWGFVMAIYFLRNPTIPFEDAIKITLMKGGDTDTNAAIIGGLVGTYHIVPEYMIKPVLDFDCTILSSKYHRRPIEYSVKKSISLLI